MHLFISAADRLTSKGLYWLAILFFSLGLQDAKFKRHCVFQLTFCYDKLRKYKKGIKLIKNTKSEFDEDTVFQLAHFHAMIGNFKQAENLYTDLYRKSLLKSETPDYQLLANLLEVYRLDAKLEPALKIVKSHFATPIAQNQVKYLNYNIANVLADSGDNGNAIRYYKQAKEDGYERVSRLYYNLGNSLLRIGKTKEALECFLESLCSAKDKIESAKANDAIGEAYENLGNLEKATHHYRLAARRGHREASLALPRINANR